jgi:iron complex transport system substrate-binding protein
VTTRARIIAAWTIGLTLLLPALARADRTRAFVDSAGRRVEVPARIERVFAAGPPATVLIYTLARDTLLGWFRPLTLDERSYIPARYADRPTLGKLTGRSNVPNLEVVRDAKPDVIVDYGPIQPKDVALAERIQRETGVPYVLIDGGLSAIPKAYELAGELLGAQARAGELGRHAERVLARVDERVARVPTERRPAVYYGRGAKGLDTELIESLDRLGARNVATGAIERGPLVPVSIEQVRAWEPEVMLAFDARFVAGAGSDPAWQSIRAVRDGRVYRVPTAPFGWLDTPPSVNRLIGLEWLGRVLYPDLFPEDLRAEARAFYALFYQHALDDEQLDALLGEARARPAR